MQDISQENTNSFTPLAQFRRVVASAVLAVAAIVGGAETALALELDVKFAKGMSEQDQERARKVIATRLTAAGLDHEMSSIQGSGFAMFLRDDAMIAARFGDLADVISVLSASVDAGMYGILGRSNTPYEEGVSGIVAAHLDGETTRYYLMDAAPILAFDATATFDQLKIQDGALVAKFSATAGAAVTDADGEMTGAPLGFRLGDVLLSAPIAGTGVIAREMALTDGKQSQTAYRALALLSAPKLPDGVVVQEQPTSMLLFAMLAVIALVGGVVVVLLRKKP